jgi:cell division protein FtsW (lipid II flippase)
VVFKNDGGTMVIFGVILIIIGAVANIPILYTIGVILLLIGLVLWIAGAMGHAVGGRRHFF